MNPKFWDDLPSPFTPKYPTWESLPSLSNAEIFDLWMKTGVFLFPYLSDRPWETYRPGNMYRPTPRAKWKVIPDEPFREFLGVAVDLQRLRGGEIGACLAISYTAVARVRVWLPNATVFQAAGDEFVWGARVHSINMANTVDKNGVGHYFYSDGGQQYKEFKLLVPDVVVPGSGFGMNLL